MNRNEFIETFWRYYQSLEEDFERTTRYVSLNEKNYNTFSIEYARLLQAICSEVEVILKQVGDIDPENDLNIDNLMDQIRKNIDKHFFEHTIYLQKYIHISIKPFKENVSKKGIPFWWSIHNGIKHNRQLKMEESNLKCVLYALAGLYFCEDYLLSKIAEKTGDVDIMDEPSSLFASDISKNNISTKDIVLEKSDFYM